MLLLRLLAVLSFSVLLASNPLEAKAVKPTKEKSAKPKIDEDAEKEAKNAPANHLAAQKSSHFGIGGTLSIDTIKLKDTAASIELGGFGLTARGQYRLFSSDQFFVVGTGGVHVWGLYGKSTGDIEATYSVNATDLLIGAEAYYAIWSGFIGGFLKYEHLLVGGSKIKVGNDGIDSSLDSFTVTAYGLGGGYAIDKHIILGGYVSVGAGSYQETPETGPKIDALEFSSQEIAFTFDYFL